MHISENCCIFAARNCESRSSQRKTEGTINHTLYAILLILSLSLIGCKPGVVEEAETLLCEADSLRVKGIPPTDSSLWAQTVADLSPWRYFYSTDYAKANYYYGYLLRLKDHSPEAMQCFINATHTHTKDYNLLGRIWSNIGQMCRMDGNYDLAYEIYQKTVDYFQLAHNETAYYYAISNMALQRALQEDKPATIALLSKIEQECTDSAVLNKILEIKAFACYKAEEYDSVIYFVNRLHSQGYHKSTGYVNKAQAYWYLHQYDSSLYYAQIALSYPCNRIDSVSMLYITSHHNPSIDSDSILSITSERADKQVEYTHAQEQLAHAVEILEQSMKPNYKWVYGAAATLFIIGVILTIILFVTKRHRAAKHAQLKAEEEKHRTLVSKNSELEQKCEVRQTDIQTRLEHECQALRTLTDKQFVSSLHWRDYDMMLSTVEMRFYGFIGKLQNYYQTEQNTRLCILLFIDIPKHRMAELLYCSPNSIGKMKERVAEKIGVRGNELHDFLWKMMCE